MARMPYVSDVSDVDDEIRQRRGGTLRPLDRMLLHSPPFAKGWNSFLGAVRERGTLDGGLRELVILRVAVLNDCAYEWDAHEPVARREGLSDQSIQLVRLPDAPSSLTGLESKICTYVDQMTRDVVVDDNLFDELLDELGERTMIELTVTSAAYNMVSRFLVATDVGETRTAAPNRKELCND
ncbi:Carboxymuconolactone decarboxylase [Pseudoclavibacter sp. 8L]|nr:Carboxymuconolactone decarboxylase [Pseudoclavibacter sp. 8L]